MYFRRMALRHIDQDDRCFTFWNDEDGSLYISSGDGHDTPLRIEVPTYLHTLDRASEGRDGCIIMCVI